MIGIVYKNLKRIHEENHFPVGSNWIEWGPENFKKG
jgi:hypothetical protein